MQIEWRNCRARSAMSITTSRSTNLSKDSGLSPSPFATSATEAPMVGMGTGCVGRCTKCPNSRRSTKRSGNWSGDMTTAHILTKKQAATLDFIRAFITQEGMPPTRKEISDGLGHSSPNGANDGLRVLAKHGYLTLLPRRSRGIRLNLEKCK